MSIHKISRELVAYRNRLAQLAKDNGRGNVQLASEEVARLVEELTATNEELQSLNRQLQNKNQALTNLNTDLQHLVDNVDAAVLFVDRDLRVTRFTPAVTQIFPLRTSDSGRRLADFTSKLRGVDLTADLKAVLSTGTEIEREGKVEADQKVHAALMRIRPYRVADGSIHGLVLSLFDIDTIFIAAHEVTARYAALSRASGDAILGLSLDGVVNAWSPGAERLLGYTADEMVGKHISILAPEGLEAEQRVLLEQIRCCQEVLPYDTVRRHKDGSIVQVSIRAAPVLSLDENPIGVSETMRDVGDRKRAEERNALLTRELAHRTKNLLSLVHSTMVQTAQHSTNKQSFIQSVDDRLRALSEAQDLLLANNLKGAFVADVVGSCLKPFIVNDTSVEMHGPSVFLKADVVHNLSLVLHELATNALKYGALTHTHGKVLVSWQLDGPEAKSARFRISWREVEGPLVEPPARTGFGTEVINNAPKHEPGAQVSLDYSPAGLQWSLEMPADREVESGKGTSSRPDASHQDACITQLNDFIVDRIATLRAALGDRVNVSASLQPGLAPIKVEPGELWSAILIIALHAREAVERGKFAFETRNIVLDKRGRYVQLSLTHGGPPTPGADLPEAYRFLKQSGAHVSLESEGGSGTTINFYFPPVAKEMFPQHPAHATARG